MYDPHTKVVMSDARSATKEIQFLDMDDLIGRKMRTFESATVVTFFIIRISGPSVNFASY